jgi:predicted nuclease of predicted toxin-antitoxin system
MRVLLDEQLDRRLRLLFAPEFQVSTVLEQGWSGMDDEALLRAAQNEFDVLVTMDRGIPHQQNVRDISLGVIVVRAFSNRRRDVAPLIPRVNEALRIVGPGQVLEISSS